MFSGFTSPRVKQPKRLKKPIVASNRPRRDAMVNAYHTLFGREVNLQVVPLVPEAPQTNEVQLVESETAQQREPARRTRAKPNRVTKRVSLARKSRSRVTDASQSTFTGICDPSLESQDDWKDYFGNVSGFSKPNAHTFFDVKLVTGQVVRLPSICLAPMLPKVNHFLEATYDSNKVGLLKSSSWYLKMKEASETSEETAARNARVSTDFVVEDEVLHWTVVSIRGSIHVGSDMLFIVKWSTGDTTLEPSRCLAGCRKMVDALLRKQYGPSGASKLIHSKWYQFLVQAIDQ